MNATQEARRSRWLVAAVALGALLLLGVGMLAGSLVSAPARAAGPAPAAAPAQTIDVTGVGQVQVAPDQADLQFHIHVTGATADAALAAYNKASDALGGALHDLKVADADITTGPPSIYQDDSVKPQPMTPAAPADSPAAPNYVADGAVTVRLRDLATLQSTAAAGVKAAPGIGIGGVQYGLQNDKAARDQALPKALDTARAQADAVAAKLGLTVQGVAGVTVQPIFSPPGPWASDAKAPMAAGQGGDLLPAALGHAPDLQVQVTVQVSYNFK